MARYRIILDTLLSPHQLAPILDQVGAPYTVEVEEFRNVNGHYGKHQRDAGELDTYPAASLTVSGPTTTSVLRPLTDEEVQKSLEMANQRAKEYLHEHLWARATISGIRSVLEANGITPGLGIPYWPTTRLQRLVAEVRKEKMSRGKSGLELRQEAKAKLEAKHPPTANKRTNDILQVVREHALHMYPTTASTPTALDGLRLELNKAGIRLPKSGKWANGTLIRYIRRVQRENAAAKAARKVRLHTITRDLIAGLQPKRPTTDKNFLTRLAGVLKDNDILPERGKPRWTFPQLRSVILDATAELKA